MQGVVVNKHRGCRWLAAAIIAGGLLGAGATAADEIKHRLEGKVIRVIDGDTLRLQAEGRRF